MEILGYEIIRELGQGGMATVYLAVQQSLGRQVALKVMNPSLVIDSDFRERFYREGQIIARLVHPQIVTVYDFGSRNDIHFLSMEHLSGGSLKERIKAGLRPKQAAEIIAPIANALAYAHRHGVVHRDVKPQNILFRADGTSVLTDFGIARVLDVDTHLTQTGFTIGSPRYMSPEQVLGSPVDSRSDIYSLGIVFYEMLTGEIPWSDTQGPVGLAMKHCTAPIPILDPELRGFQGLLEKCLAKEPDDRYQNADDFASSVSALVSSDSYRTELPTRIAASPDRPSLATIKRPDIEAEQPPEKKSRARSTGAIIFLAVVLIAVGGFFGVEHFIDKKENAFLLGLELPAAIGDRPIAGSYEALAIEHLRKQELNLSMELIQSGLRAVPNDDRLLALQGIVERHQAAQRHLATAKRYFERGVLEASSLEVEKGLGAVPDHPKLLQLQDQLQTKLRERHARKAKQLLEQAQQYFRAGDLDASLARISEGLWQVPDHQGLLSLQGEIANHVARRRQVDAFLEQAHRLEQQEHWQQALGAVREGISIDADDPRLKETEERLEAGLQRYRLEETDRLLGEASRQREAGEFEASLRIIDDGLWLVPEHSGLLELRREIQQAIERRKQARALLMEARKSAAEDDLDTSLRLIDEGLSLTGDDEELLQLKEQVDSRLRERAAQEARNLYAQAVALRGSGELKESLDLVDKGLALVPGDEQLLTLQGRLQEDITQRARRAGEANALVERARERLKANAPQDAIELAEQVLALVPTHAGALALKQEAQESIALEKTRALAEEYLATTRKLLSDDRLEEARSRVAQGLAEIPGNDALIVLKKDIDAKIEAREKQQAIEQRTLDLLAKARSKRKAGALGEALELVDTALGLTPDNTELINLRQEVLSQLDRHQTISNYLAEAQLLRLQGELQQGLDRIDAALGLSPDDPKISALRTQIAAEIESKSRQEDALTLLRQAESAREQDKLADGLALAEQGLDLVPADPRLLELAAGLKAEIEKRRVNEEQSEDFRSQAQAKLDAGAADEALALVERALRLTPENAEGLALRDRISEQLDLRRTVDNYVTDAERLRAEGSLEQSLDRIDAALQIAPDTPQAVALREQVAAEMDQRTREQRAVADQQRKREQAAALLRQAQQMLNQGELEKGLSTVQQGLALTPDDTQLSELKTALQTKIDKKQAKKEQASALEAQALAKRKAGALNEAFELAKQALRLTPDDTDLLDLRQGIEAEIEAHQTIEGYLVDAQRLTGEGKFKQAIDLIDKALQHANDVAKRGVLGAEAMSKIEQRSLSQRQATEEQQRRRNTEDLLTEALRKKNEGDLEASLALVEQGLKVTPDNADLSELADGLRTEIQRQRAIEQETKATERDKAKVEALLAQCREHLDAKRLTTGTGGTALLCFNDVLKIDPDNDAAREGLQAIADRYAAWAVSALAGKKLSSAGTYIERLATVDPEYDELDNLRRRLDEQRKALAATPQPRQKRSSTKKRTKPRASTRKTQPRSKKRAPVITRKAPANTPPPVKRAPPPPTTTPRAPKKKRYGVTF